MTFIQIKYIESALKIQIAQKKSRPKRAAYAVFIMPDEALHYVLYTV